MTQQMPPLPPSQPPRKSWWGRNWKWVVPVGCLTPIILCGGFITVIFVAVFGAIKSSDPYKQSLARVQESAEVQEMLGTPIEPSFWAGGSISVENADGNAELVYTVSGPKGSGVVHTSATKSAGTWTFDSLQVQSTSGQQTIDLVQSSHSETTENEAANTDADGSAPEAPGPESP